MLVTPIPGAHRDNVLKALRSVHTAAGNIDGRVYAGAYDRLFAYLRWANDSERLLTSQISARDIDRLIRTRTYQNLLTGIGGPYAGIDQQPLVNGVLNVEIEHRIAALGDAVKAFQDQMEKWPAELTLLVPDSSFYIHHDPKFEDVDVAGLVGGGPVRVLFPMAVVDELDRLKENKDKQTRWRAGHTLAVLDRLLDDATARAPHDVEVLPDPPGHVRLPVTDDEIIDRALAVQAIAAGPVQLVTYDTGQALRAKRVGLAVLKLRTDAGTGEEPGPARPGRSGGR
ncbi:PIN domain-containing protein [Streptomyces fradiae]|uniref:PIN domain-containing protein n=1 Tax=Streptomyces fradiae TaxID=1906 RepID=UPI0038111391